MHITTDISSVNLDNYYYDYDKNNTQLTDSQRKRVRDTHLERIKAGKEVWNQWAKQVTKAIEAKIKQEISNNTQETEEQNIKEKIYSRYLIDFCDCLFIE